MSKTAWGYKFCFLISAIFLFGLLNTPSVFAATFVVTSTGDQSDVTAGDGSCITSVATCTLRAAIQEANALAGADTINFNIPTSDTGYKSFNVVNPLTPLPGDSLGGDDYWLIAPATAYPAITETLSIDGASQETNQGDKFTGMPDIEIMGTTAGEVNGLRFTSTAINSSVNSLTINRFGSGASFAAIEDDADGFTVTKSNLGLNVSGLGGFAERQFHGIRVVTASNVRIGIDTSTGNIISNNGSYGVMLACGVTGTGRSVKVRGNIIGLDKNGNNAIPNGAGILNQGECLSEIGGDSVTHRNVIGGHGSHAINTLLAQNNIPKVEIYNNFIGTDITGTLSRPNRRQVAVEWGGTAYIAPTPQVIIGGLGKGNLIRFGVNGNLRLAHGPRNVEFAYNTDSDSNECGTEVSGGHEVYMHDNYFGYAASDPHFGIAVGRNSWFCGVFLDGATNSRIENNITSDESMFIGGTNNIVDNNTTIASPLNTLQTNGYPAISVNYGTGNTIKRFYSGTLGVLPIAISGGVVDGNGIMINDSLDVDTGTNDLMNYPVINSIEFYTATKTYKIFGDIDHAVSEAPISIEVCEATNHALNHGGCLTSLGFVSSSSPWELDYVYPTDTGNEGRKFTALATNAGGSTSEFALNFDASIINPNYTIITPTPTPSPAPTTQYVPSAPVEVTSEVTPEVTITETPTVTPTITAIITTTAPTTAITKQTSGDLANNGISPLLYICLIIIVALVLVFAFLILSRKKNEEK